MAGVLEQFERDHLSISGKALEDQAISIRQVIDGQFTLEQENLFKLMKRQASRFAEVLNALGAQTRESAVSQVAPRQGAGLRAAREGVSDHGMGEAARLTGYRTGKPSRWCAAVSRWQPPFHDGG